MRIAVLFDHYGPYHLARVEALSRRTEVLALQTRARSLDYGWSGAAETKIEVRTLQADKEATGLEEAFQRALASFSPDLLVLPGWSDRAAITGMEVAKRSGIPVVLMSESTAHDAARSPWKEFIKRRYVSLASAALVGGTPHRSYLRQLGMADEAIFEGYDAVDNDHFARESARWRESDQPQTPYFLASNRFIEKKNLFRLLDAYALHRTKDKGPGTKDGHPWPLTLLGDGELKPALLAHAAQLGLSIAERAPWEPSTKNEEPGTRNPREEKPEVYLPGFRQIDELPRFYAHAGAFVHASTVEQWGLVVNEAMASGLPVIVSNRCGCAPDLVRDEVNGWTFDPFDTEGLATLLSRLASMPDSERRSLGEESRNIVAHWGPDRFAGGLEAAAKRAIGSQGKSFAPTDRLLVKLMKAICRQ